MRSRIACRYACPLFSWTPFRARSTAGPKSSRHGSVPKERCACSKPTAAPGTAQEAAPMWKAWVEPPLKSTSTRSISASLLCSSPRPGTETKKSKTRVDRSRARWTSMKPPEPGPVSGLSATQETSAAPTAASTAFPPAASTSAPACAVSGCPAATAPLMREGRSEEHTSELQSPCNLVCRLLLEKKKKYGVHLQRQDLHAALV